MRDRVFFSYNQKDKSWLDEIQKGLQPLLQQKSFLLWDETKIQAGQNWQEEIEHALSQAKVAVLLVSRDFLSSDFIAKHILPPVLNAAENDGLIILWVAVRTCAYKATQIGNYKAVNNPSKPLASMKGRGELDEALLDICQQIAEAANRELENPPGALVVNVPAPVVTMKGIPVASRAELQQIMRSHFDINMDACFVRQKELDDLFKNVLHGSSRIFQGAHGAGKTTLLKQLQVLCEKQHIPIRYIDFSTLKGPLQTTLWRNVCHVLANAAPDVIRPEEVEVYLSSQSLAKQAVICLDNVDALAGKRISIEEEMGHLASLVRWLKVHHKPTTEFSVILTIHSTFDVHRHASGYASPWFTQFGGIFWLEELSETRSVELLHGAGISNDEQLAFCLDTATYRLPLDLLLLACLLKEHTHDAMADYELIEAIYHQFEPLLRS